VRFGYCDVGYVYLSIEIMCHEKRGGRGTDYSSQAKKLYSNQIRWVVGKGRSQSIGETEGARDGGGGLESVTLDKASRDRMSILGRAVFNRKERPRRRL
jgi:hypothetical protein